MLVMVGGSQCVSSNTATSHACAVCGFILAVASDGYTYIEI